MINDKYVVPSEGCKMSTVLLLHTHLSYNPWKISFSVLISNRCEGCCWICIHTASGPVQLNEVAAVKMVCIVSITAYIMNASRAAHQVYVCS